MDKSKVPRFLLPMVYNTHIDQWHIVSIVLLLLSGLALGFIAS